MNWQDFDWLIDAALAEDAADRDVTTRAVVAPQAAAEGTVRAEESGVICGLPLARRLAERFDARLAFEELAHDGDRIVPGQAVARLSGPAASILSVERTMLNFLQQLSGMATVTALFVEQARGTCARIFDTRKTIPGWRALSKYAVRCGGGENHRMDLAQQALIKDNHLALSAAGEQRAAAVRRCLERVRAAAPGIAVEVEVEDQLELEAAIDAGADIILLDNMDPARVRQAVKLTERRCAGGTRPLLEASGGITLANVAQYAAAGVDRISVGVLTHSAPALSLSLELVRRDEMPVSGEA